jgi:hypothetical protein
VRFEEREEEVFFFGWEDEILEEVFGPGDFAEVLDAEENCSHVSYWFSKLGKGRYLLHSLVLKQYPRTKGTQISFCSSFRASCSSSSGRVRFCIESYLTGTMSYSSSYLWPLGIGGGGGGGCPILIEGGGGPR